MNCCFSTKNVIIPVEKNKKAPINLERSWEKYIIKTPVYKNENELSLYLIFQKNNSFKSIEFSEKERTLLAFTPQPQQTKYTKNIKRTAQSLTVKATTKNKNIKRSVQKILLVPPQMQHIKIIFYESENEGPDLEFF